MNFIGDYVMLAKAQNQMAETYYLKNNYSQSIKISKKSIERAINCINSKRCKCSSDYITL